jgi:hypothetical protein
MAASFELDCCRPLKPELFLTSPEREWAASERKKLPPAKPVCILSSRALTDAGHLQQIDWEGLGVALSADYTIIQPVLTRAEVYHRQIAGTVGNWISEPIAKDAVTFENLPLRQYLSLFSIADLYVGPPSGGSHAAAAFEVPSLIILWQQVIQSLAFPVPAGTRGVHVFLYPQHRFLAAESLRHMDHAAVARFQSLVDECKSARSDPAAWQVNVPLPRRWLYNRSGRIVSVLGRPRDGRLRTPWAPALGV